MSETTINEDQENLKDNSRQAYFNDIEARVMACLMEKQLTTPNNYPLSMNSLLLACNQKTNRVPVMNLTEGELGHTVNQLDSRKLVGVDYGGRATHVTHRVMTEFDIDRKQQAVLAVLMVKCTPHRVTVLTEAKLLNTMRSLTILSRENLLREV